MTSADHTAAEWHNPWRDFIENVISGDNYFRSSEYRDLLEELDGLYSDRAELLRALTVILSALDALDEMDNLRHIAHAAIAKATGAAS